MNVPVESICFIFSTPRMRVSSFFACEYHMLNSFLYVKDNLLRFLKSFVPSALRNDSLIHLFLRDRASGKCCGNGRQTARALSQSGP